LKNFSVAFIRCGLAKTLVATICAPLGQNTMTYDIGFSNELSNECVNILARDNEV
jgi:hypothetical protein